ncbi:ribonuclease E/G [Miniphocaeibacter massiliensis]|uniref:ribonuclease E/G n=1 Tax=Miniphocaeibacter massiliensis TaxID=2041841 RepID=UPI000C1C52E6|nr:ribonuclease E/G [Miniphocaeibacter massiliensis]
MKYYFIYTDNNKTIIGLSENNKLKKLNIFNDYSLRDDVYIAKVTKELHSIKGYIIEIEKDVKACIEKRHIPKGVKLGNEIIVQLYKKTDSNKFDKFTTDYSISGKKLVYYPNRKKNTFSKKIKKEIKEKFILENDLSTFEGITFRTDSLNYAIEELKEENYSLKNINKFIIKQSKFLPIPRKIYSNIKYIYEFIDGKFDYIITNNKEKFNSLKEYFKDKEIIYEENYNYEYDENISKDLLSLEQEKIEILQNSNIVIQNTEALTVIDVNSGQDTNFLEINKEAISESIRQVELRDISGIILIDIINIKSKDMKILCKFIENKLKEYTQIKFYGISNIGLLEFIRTRIKIDN